jgi:putative ABC transport system permease protein
MREIWNNIYPNEPYIFTFLDDEFKALYDSDVAFGRVFAVFAFLAIFMAATGLFAAVKFTSELKFKEIGVRKVNGATIGEIVMFLNSGYLKTIIYSFLLSIPFAWYAMHSWLQNFAYKINLSWWIFVLSGILVLGIAMLTVSLQSWKAARQNPVDALRCE